MALPQVFKPDNTLSTASFLNSFKISADIDQIILALIFRIGFILV